jgi:hypothetical protein
LVLKLNPNWRSKVKAQSWVAKYGEAYGYWNNGTGDMLPFQYHALNEMYAQKRNKEWKYNIVGMNMPRQNGKTEMLKPRIIQGLYQNHEDIFYTAQEGQLAHDMFEFVYAAITHYPELAAEVAKVSTSVGKESIILSTGGSIYFRSRKNGMAGLGGSKDCVIFDEAQELRSDFESMVMRVEKARPNAQLIYVGTPFLSNSEGDTFNGLIERAKEDDTVFIVRYGVDDENADVNDERLWKLTNPLYPDIIRKRAFTDEIASAMQHGEEGLRDFRVQDLGLWWKDSIPPAIPKQLWEDSVMDLANDKDTNVACVVNDPTTQTIAMSIASYNTTIINGTETIEAGKYITGDIYEERSGMDSWQWVADKIGSMPRNTTVLLDLGGLDAPIRDILPRNANIAKNWNGQEFLASQQGFLKLITSGIFKHPDSPMVAEEVHNAQREQSGNLWKFSPIRTENTIAGLKALSMAAWYRHTMQVKKKSRPKAVY